jgi:uncharacterized membrane protein
MVRFFEHIKRSLVKTITYRIFIVISTFIITFWITGRIDLTLWVTITANLTNTVLYFIHERIWNHIHWGKTK